MCYIFLTQQCPYCKRADNLAVSSDGNNFCLETWENGNKQFKRNHAYYYQVRKNNYKLLIIDTLVKREGAVIRHLILDGYGWTYYIKSLYESSEMIFSCIGGSTACLSGKKIL